MSEEDGEERDSDGKRLKSLLWSDKEPKRRGNDDSSIKARSFSFVMFPDSTAVGLQDVLVLSLAVKVFWVFASLQATGRGLDDWRGRPEMQWHP